MNFQTTTPTQRSRGLFRIPQMVGGLAAVASIVILVTALIMPEVFSRSSGRRPEVDIAGLQMTAEAEWRKRAPTSEVSLSDLAPTSALTAAPTSVPADSSGTVLGSSPPAAPPPEPVKVGVALEEFPGDFGAIAHFGESSGRAPDLVMFFQAWGDADRDFKHWLPELSNLGITPLITWEPWDRDDFIDQRVYTLQSILDGVHDAYIDNWAERAVEYGDPIYLRFAHEMNTPRGKTYWYPWQGDPEQYVAVWRYVHKRFEAAGADNVEWVWSVAWMNDDARLYYPGDEYVDWVGVTVLNFGEGKPDSYWRSFNELYSIQQSRVLSYNKPVMITELATAEQGGDKGEWIAAIGDDIQQHFPEIGALIWLNYSESREFEAINWRVDSSSGALEGWRQLLRHPVITSP